MTHEKVEAEKILPEALPPPDAAATAPRRRPPSLQRILCVACAFFAAAVLLFYGIKKLDEVAEKGLLESLGEVLLAGNTSLGTSIGETAFGAPQTGIDFADIKASAIALPRIYYIPKENIIDSTFDSSKEHENKLQSLYSFDYSKVPSGAYPIIPTDVSTKDATALKNDTSFTVDMTEIAKLAAMRKEEVITDEPLVLIVHTHGTESFSSEDSICYSDNFNNPRSEDVSENVVAVGRTLAEALNKKGIPTIHCETMHDKESYISAYERSAESIAHYIEKYPSIRYVFDVHRDSLIQNDLTKLRPVTLRDGEECAQIMMIVGSSEKSQIEYDWRANLVLAEGIQKNLIDETSGIARQIYLRGATYNQQYALYGLLLEIGSCGNDLSEAKNAALAFADAFEKVIKCE